MFCTENKSHIPNNPLREDIVREVKRYIGHAYANDFHAGNYITVDKISLSVDFWSRNRCDEPKNPNCHYYDIFSLLQPGKSSLTFEPDEIAIDIAVLDFFPIQKVDYFVSKAKSAISEFHRENGEDNFAVLGITYSPLEMQVFNPNNLPEATDEDYSNMIDELDDCPIIEEFELKYFVKTIDNGELFINENKLKRLAIEKFEEY